MKILVVGDVHFCQYSSILRERGELYSKRLENLLWSLNWVEDQATTHKCGRVIYLGDFFDRSDANAEELTALTEVKWSDVLHVCLVGNHELGRADGSYSSAHLFNNLPNFCVVDTPAETIVDGTHILYLPYIFEENRQQLKSYIKDPSNKYIIFSHNDIKGINYGLVESREGFELDDIKDTGAFFINGHIHNGQKLCKNVLNLGNLTGQNFSEDAFKYQHQIMVLDTETMAYELLENPYAFNFYKLEINNLSEFNKISFKNNAVLSLKVPESIANDARELIKKKDNICNYRLTIIPERNNEGGQREEIRSEINHLQKFNDFILEKLGDSDVVRNELKELLQ